MGQATQPNGNPAVDGENLYRQYLESRRSDARESCRLEEAHPWLRGEVQRRFDVQRQFARLVKAMGERYSPDRVSLDNYAVTDPKQRVVLERIKALAERMPDAVKRGESILLYGSCGTGKDHLLASLLHMAARKHHLSAVWQTGLDFFAECRDRMKGGGETEFISELASVDILAFSDPVPPASAPSDWALGQLHSVVDIRYRSLKPTWLTVNARDENELRDVLSVALCDRLRDGHVIQCTWPSYRG
jgi:DNA replication protein DnaC